ncbi:flagellar biosynthesis protein FlgA [Rothia sp. P7181]|uniref:flagellar biosynthesis protein FlgA n=1 Tax=unclassified Rothia (in: high G+C Gram-positive bacteria) TaxID=2689056 RepID=UPI003AC7BB3D
MKTDPKAPKAFASRLQKPGFKDPKLLIGLFLILMSLTGVITVVNISNQTKPYWVTTREIYVGEEISEKDLKKVDVRLSEASSHYLSTEDSGTPHIATQFIGAHQLIPKNSLGEVEQNDRKKTTIVLDSTIASGYKAGDLVDVWVSSKNETGNGYATPVRLMEQAEIARINSEDSVLGSTGKTALQLLVSEDVLSSILHATSNDSKISLVPSF